MLHVRMAAEEIKGSAARPAGTFGKYELIEPLGKGGMAEVWRARIKGPAGFARTVVLKRILPHLAEDESFVSMFLAEARLSAKLSHPNIIQVYELGKVGAEYFIAMEYVRGLDLASLANVHLRDLGPIPVAPTVHVMRDVCRALKYAHEFCDEDGQRMRLIHRDVSPSNVMLSDEGAVKLLDFGIAKALVESGEGQSTGSLKGKFGYMAPEQLEGNDFDHRADIFSTGVVMHEMLVGKRLFRGKNDLATISLVKAAEVEPPSRTRPDVPTDLDRIVLKALARQPDARFQSAREMAQELDELVHALRVGLPDVARLVHAVLPSLPRPAPTPTPAPVTVTQAPPSPAPSPSPHVDERATLVEIPAIPEELAALGSGRTSRRRIVVIGALGLVGVAIGLSAAPWPTPPAPAPPMAVPAPPSAAPKPLATTPTRPPSTTVSVAIASQPPGADVFLDGETRRRGKTPLTLDLPRADAQHAIRLVARGYLPAASQFSTASDLKLTLPLVRAPHRLTPPLHPNPNSNNEGDDLANPFPER
jgi:serine/threonine protein kinase